MGLYELQAETEDTQEPHKLDEVYYVVKGNARLVAGEDTTAVQPGTIVYVKANIPHRFIDITEDLQVLVVFSKTDPYESDPELSIARYDELTGTRNPSQNVWTQFLSTATLRMGLYILPKNLGGDQALTHNVDEINIVVNGRGTFVVGDDEFKIKPGSIIFVEKGNGHYFKHQQDEALDILILFQRKRTTH